MPVTRSTQQNLLRLETHIFIFNTIILESGSGRPTGMLSAYGYCQKA